MSAIFQVYGLTAADGALSWRALNALTADALPTEGAARGRIQIMPIGQWDGHPSGPLKITPEYLADIIAQFEAQTNEMPLDYDHSAPKKGDTRAAGWIRSLEIEGDWLCGEVEWTPAAAEAIRAKEYLFTSPWWDEKPKDRVTGKTTGPRMFNVALTNLPFFDGQKPLMCSALAGDAPESTDTNEAKPMDEFLAAVAKSAGSTPEAVMAQLMAKADEIGAMLRDAPAKEAADAPPAVEIEVEGDDDAAKIAAAAEAQRIASEGRFKGLIASVAELQASVASLTKERDAEKSAASAKVEADRAERIASMGRDGRLGKDELEDAAKLLAFDAALFESTYKDRKPTVQVGAPPQAGHEKPPVIAAEDHTEGFTASERIAYRSLTQGARFTPDAARKGILAQRPVVN